jgi:hypothetical protein
MYLRQSDLNVMRHPTQFVRRRQLSRNNFLPVWASFRKSGFMASKASARYPAARRLNRRVDHNTSRYIFALQSQRPTAATRHPKPYPPAPTRYHRLSKASVAASLTLENSCAGIRRQVGRPFGCPARVILAPGERLAA